LSDTEAPANEQDTPTPADDAPPANDADTEASQSDSTTDSTDWRKRYEDLQPAFTRVSQEASQLRQIIDAARQGDPEALEFLGLDLADTDDDEDFEDDPYEPISKAEFQEFLRQQQEQERQAQEQAAWEEAAEERFDEFVSKLGDDADEDYLNLVLSTAEPDEQGLPDFEGAHKRIQAFLEAQRQKWVESKRAPRLPGGAAPNKQPNLDDPNERREYLAQRLMMEAQGP